MSKDHSKTALRPAPSLLPGVPGAYAFLGVAAGIPAVLTEWQRRASERAHLRDLEAHLLDDAGLSPQARDREARKPFWRR